MKAVYLHNVFDLRMHEEPVPARKDDEELVRITSVGVCGSDIHWYTEGHIGKKKLTKPAVLGHEFSGFVEEGKYKGKIIAFEPGIFCGKCEHCLTGQPYLCKNGLFAGEGYVGGGLQEYIKWPTHSLFPLPDGITSDEGAIIELIGVCLHAIDMATPIIGDRVGIYGCGPVGLVLIQVVKKMGALQIIATDKLPHRLAAAKAYGATHTILAKDKSEEAAEILDITQGEGVDIAYEVAGANDAVVTSIETAKPGGKVILIGIHADDQVAFNSSTARNKALIIKFLMRVKYPFPRAIRLVENGVIDLKSLVSDRFPLDKTEEAFKFATERKGLKVIINPTKSA